MALILYVANLPFTTTEAELLEIFRPYGTVVKVQLIQSRETGQSRGFAFVEMRDGHAAAIEGLHGAEFQGRRLTVNEAEPPVDRPRGGNRRRGGRRGGR